MTKPLTAQTIASLPSPASGQSITWDAKLPGFGVLVGASGSKSYVVTGRVRGVRGADGKEVKRRVVIGKVGGLREDGAEWTVQLAREAAQAVLVQMRQGTDPNQGKRTTSAPVPVAPTGPTLREAMNAHLANMRKKHRAERSLSTFQSEMEKYLAAWLDRPIADLTVEALTGVHDGIKENSRDKGGRNASNAKGAFAANRVVMHVSAAWNSLNALKGGQLGNWNPAKAVVRDELLPKRERVVDLADWTARVQTMADPIREDGLHLALYTGLRHEEVREVRHEHVNVKAKSLRVVDPKGGEERAFEIPLGPHALAILKRRKASNAKDFGGDDGGFVFPGRANDGSVGPIGDLRKQLHGEAHERFPAEDVHTLRRTFLTVAHEEGVSELDQHVLSNHSYGSGNVNATYIAQHMDHLRACAQKIDAGITRRLAPPKTKRKR